MRTGKGSPNHLAGETSPYLLQHEHNPVDWYPWGEEALEKARRENKPIFLSLGYSTCHWCHVMERESFEDDEVAAALNADFVSVKVDREQRPDIDHTYMLVTQVMTGSGGWPNTLLLTPDLQAFFAATYLPKPNLLHLLSQAAKFWRERQADVERQAGEIAEELRPMLTPSMPGHVSESSLIQGASDLMARYDPRYGGFGSGVKFPTPINLIFLLRSTQATGEPAYAEAALRTLKAIRQGGIYDQVGLGAHRYSVDPYWHVPHFEKMLYDQAMLAMAYIEAYRFTREPFYRTVAEEILTYVDRDLSDPAGGFWSAQDADSEGEEGKFYFWRTSELEAVLGPKDAAFALDVFEASEAGNFENGVNVLRLREDVDPADSQLALIRGTLRDVRSKRIPPITDDKVLTDWNGLMTAAFAMAGATFEDERWTSRAQTSAGFLIGQFKSDQGLPHQYRQGKSQGVATLDDHGFLLWALIELYQADFDPKWLRSARDVATETVAQFQDPDSGSFFLSQSGDKYLPRRPIQVEDGPTISGFAATAYNLARLSALTGNLELESAAEKAVGAVGALVERHPGSAIGILLAVDFLVRPRSEVAVAGDLRGNGMQALLSDLRGVYSPRTVFLVPAPDLAEVAPFTKDLRSIEGKPTAYVCRRGSCELPTNHPEEAVDLLESSSRMARAQGKGPARS